MVQRKERQEKACQKAMMVFRTVVFAFTSPTKVQARTFTKTKAEERIKRKRQRRNLSSIQFSASETPNEEGYGQARESDDWSASHWPGDSWTPDAGGFCIKAPLNLTNHPTHVVLDLGCTVDGIEIGNRKIQEACMVC